MEARAMAYLFQEIEYASYLLARNKKAQAEKTYIGAISNHAQEQVKNFLFQCKITLQKMNLTALIGNRKLQKSAIASAKGTLYIKSFFYDMTNQRLILYTRLHGKDRAISIRHIGNGKFDMTDNNGQKIADKIHRILSGIMSYWIASEYSMFNHTGIGDAPISIMPVWRHNPDII